uniref:Small RNA 2'-O-methyltransferase n=1 Tax=Caenorhabditis japonica TaxID=281687 RepID=A0A8R1IK90_CAEJA
MSAPKTYLEAYDQLEVALCEPLDLELEKADLEVFRPKFKSQHKPQNKHRTNADDDYRDVLYNYDPHKSTTESESEDDHEKKHYFQPPLQTQRNAFVRNTLLNFKIRSGTGISRLGIMGCGEMSLERGLSECLGSLAAMQVYSVDIERESLSVGQQLLEKHLTQNADLIASETGLPVLMRSFLGDILQPDHRFANMDAIVSMEVVEHIPLEDAKKFTDNVLGVLMPRIFIFSTPNHEYNKVGG